MAFRQKDQVRGHGQRQGRRPQSHPGLRLRLGSKPGGENTKDTSGWARMRLARETTGAPQTTRFAVDEALHGGHGYKSTGRRCRGKTPSDSAKSVAGIS